VKVSKVTKGLASHLKYCYGACVKRNHKLSAIQLSEKVYNILKHITDEHDCCNSAWCYDIKAKEESKVYNAPKEHRIDKVKDLVTYTQIKKIFDQYACVKQMEYCNHPFDTQTNESLNQVIVTVAPKHTCYSGSVSLQSRISILIGVHNYGNLDFFSKLSHVMGIEMTECLVLYQKQRDGKKERRREYQRQFNVKVARSQKQKKSREEVYKERTDKSYGTSTATTVVATTQLPLTALPNPAHPMMARSAIPPTPAPNSMTDVPFKAPVTALTNAPMKALVTALYPPASTLIQFGVLHRQEGYCIFTTTPAADGKKMRFESRTLLPLLPTYARQPARVHVMPRSILREYLYIPIGYV
jgi:hypothetical protein